MECPVGYECYSQTTVKLPEDYTLLGVVIVTIVVTITLALLINEIHARRSVCD